MSDIAVAESGTRLQNFLDRAGLRGFPWKTATILYTISWGWLFIVRDSYWWDDWAILNFSTWSDSFKPSGHPPWTRLYHDMAREFDPLLLRTVVFITFFVCGMFVFAILKRLLSDAGDRDDKCCRYVAVLFLLIPINTTRVSLNLFVYTIGLFYFFLAWYLAVFSKIKSTVGLSCLLFFLSFQMPALIPFFVLPLIYIIYDLRVESKYRRLKSWDFWRIILIAMCPIVYLGVRELFFPNLQENYKLKTQKIDDALWQILGAFAISLYYFKKFSGRRNVESLLLIFGLNAVVFGLTAFVATNQIGQRLWIKYPTMLFGRSGWFGRQLILQPLGIALVAVGSVVLIFKFSDQIKRLVLNVIVAFCVLMNVGFGFEYVVDYQKQIRIVEEIHNSRRAIFDQWTFIDQTMLLNARGRTYSFHDWVGLVSKGSPASLDIENVDFDDLERRNFIRNSCNPSTQSSDVSVIVNIRGPETHWEALKNWVSDGDMGFKVTVDDTPGACKPEMVTSERVSGAIPILFYFTGAKG
jgi:hypothetical protein